MTAPLAEVTTLPYESSIIATRPNAALTETLEGGCVVTTICVAAAGVTAKAEVVPVANPPPETASVYPDAAFVSESPENVATPFVAVAVSVPPSVPPPGLLPSDTVSGPL